MSDIGCKEVVEELMMLKRTVQANSDADKALDKAIESLKNDINKDMGDRSVIENELAKAGLDVKVEKVPASRCASDSSIRELNDRIRYRIEEAKAVSQHSGI